MGTNKVPLSVRNNNPLNLKNNPKDPWKGSVGTDSQGHAIFEDARWGMRAAIVNMINGRSRGLETTVAQKMESFAEDVKSNPSVRKNYLNLLRLNGVIPEHKLKRVDPLQFAKAAAIFESSRHFKPDNPLWEEGLQLAIADGYQLPILEEAPPRR